MIEKVFRNGTRSHHATRDDQRDQESFPGNQGEALLTRSLIIGGKSIKKLDLAIDNQKHPWYFIAKRSS